jgi:filamentous hemagglutinin family protein
MNRETGIRGVCRGAAAGIRVFSAQREHASQVRRLRRIARRAVAVAGVLALLAASPANSNPKGGQVAVGTAVITQTSPSRLDIVQSTDRAAIDWQSFSIAPNEHTNFQQPAPSSMTLNRVAPGDPSVIAGRLTANGGVVLVNPSGITFSKGRWSTSTASLRRRPTSATRTLWPGA